MNTYRPTIAVRAALLLALLLGGLGLASSVGALAPTAARPAPAPAAPADGTEPLPPGVQIQTVLPGLDQPIALAFDPQGRLFFTERASGNVRLYANGVLQANPVITFNVDSCGERGLLGIAVDPNFTANHYVYVYYTANPGSPCQSTQNRVARFVENNGVGSNPTTIFFSSQDAPNHNGGNIHFGPDGKLYISIGENANPANSQDVTAKNGKMHRINPDGSIPTDNPVFTQTGALGSLYAMGLRNSFDFTFDPLDLTPPYRIFASENGPSCDDELNRIEPAYNYGWRPGYPCDDANPDPTYNTIPPLWYLPSNLCCEAPTGIVVYTGNQIPQWQGQLFMTTYGSGFPSALRHFYLDPNRQFVTQTNVVLGVTANMDLENGPDGAFWYIEGGGYETGTIKRITGGGATFTPTPIPASPTPTRLPPTRTPLPPTATPGGPPTATPTHCAISFTDVDATNPFYPYVRCLVCRGVISGYADNTFRPNNDVTRGQLSKILANAAQFGEAMPSSQQTFQDVPNTNPFWLFVERLAFHSAISGYTCGGVGEPCVPPANRPYFRANLNATRGQISKITALAADMQDVVPTTRQTFQDVPNTNPFWLWIEQLAGRGVISGYTCGGPGEPCVPPGNRPYFRTGNNATRGQLAKIAANTFFPNCQTPTKR